MKSIKEKLKERTVYNLCKGYGLNTHTWGTLKRDLGEHLSKDLWQNLCEVICEHLEEVL